MRNLKRVLALALALVMILGMMVIGSSAASYSDSAAIGEEYAEAVEVLSNMGVFRGTGNGFAPKQILTRAEAATLIYRVITGDTADKQVQNYDYASLKDIKAGDWFTGYVTYANNGGYIKGDDLGNFNPYAQVTGIQVMAIMLRAAGYGQNGEYEGAAWMDNILTDARELGITGSISTATLNAPASRELVAQLIFNAITKVDMVSYNMLLGYTADWFAPETLGEKTFGLQKTTGEITAVERADGITVFTPVVEKDDNDNALDHKNAVKVIETDADWEKIGYVGSAWTVKTANAKTRTAVSDVKVIGESLGVSTNGTVYDDGSKTLRVGLTDKYDIGDNVRFYLNGVEKTYNDVKNLIGEVGVKVDLIDNDFGGVVEVIAVTHYTAAEVTGIATDSNAGTNAVKKDSYYLTNLSDGTSGREVVATRNLVCDAELAMYDIVTYVEYNRDYYVTVAPLTVDTLDEITREKVDDTGLYDTIYTIGGAEYVVADDYDLYNNAVLVKAYLGKSIDVYTDPYGYILTAALTEYDSNYVFVMANEQTSVKADTTDTKVAYADGTIDWVTVDGLYDSATDKKPETFFFASIAIEEEENEGIPNHIYAYSEDEGVYSLIKTGCAYADEIDYTNGKAAFGTLGLNKASVIVDLRTKYMGTVYTGYSEVPSLTDAAVHYLAKGGIITLAYLVDGTNAEDNSAEFIVYNTEVNKVRVSGKSYAYYLDVIVDGVVVEDYELNGDQYADIIELGVGHYKYNAKGALTYTSFAEEWVDVSWSRGTLTVYDAQGKIDAYVEYDEVPFNVLTIAKGEADGYSMLAGLDKNAVKAYVIYNGKTGAVEEIYVIADPDTAEVDAANLAVWTTGNSVWTMTGANYYAEEGEVTTVVLIPEEEPVYYTVNGDGAYALGEQVLVETLTGNYAKVTDDNNETDDLYVNINVNGNATITVTGNMTVEGGYYMYDVDGVACYTTAGVKTAAQLFDTTDGTGALWTFGPYYEAYVANAGAAIDVSLYDRVLIKTGYVKVTITDGTSNKLDETNDDVAKADSTYVLTNTGDNMVKVTVGTTVPAELDKGESCEIAVADADITIEVTDPFVQAQLN